MADVDLREKVEEAIRDNRVLLYCLPVCSGGNKEAHARMPEVVRTEPMLFVR